MNWNAFDNGKSIGQQGSEGGLVLRDDEHDDGARITLERGGQTAPFAITCGIYGWMMHTRFLGTESEAQAGFENMREELAKILEALPLAADPEADARSQLVADAISAFVEKFP